MRIILNTDELNPVSYLENNERMRRHTENHINNSPRGSYYISEAGELNYHSDSPIYYEKQVGDANELYVRVELGCDYQYDPSGDSYD